MFASMCARIWFVYILFWLCFRFSVCTCMLNHCLWRCYVIEKLNFHRICLCIYCDKQLRANLCLWFCQFMPTSANHFIFANTSNSVSHYHMQFYFYIFCFNFNLSNGHFKFLEQFSMKLSFVFFLVFFSVCLPLLRTHVFMYNCKTNTSSTHGQQIVRRHLQFVK